MDVVRARHTRLLTRHLDYLVRYWEFLYREKNFHPTLEQTYADANRHFRPLLLCIDYLTKTHLVVQTKRTPIDDDDDDDDDAVIDLNAPSDARRPRQIREDREMYNMLMARTLFLNTKVTARGTRIVEHTNPKQIMGPLFWELARLVQHGCDRMIEQKEFLVEWLRFLRTLAQSFNFCICGRDADDFLKSINIGDIQSTDAKTNASYARILTYVLHEYTKADANSTHRNYQFGGKMTEIWPEPEQQTFVYWSPCYEMDASAYMLLIRTRAIGVSCEEAIAECNQRWSEDALLIRLLRNTLQRLLPAQRYTSVVVPINTWQLPYEIWLPFLVLCTLCQRSNWTQSHTEHFVEFLRQMTVIYKMNEKNRLAYAVRKFIDKRKRYHDATPFPYQPAVHMIVFAGSNGRGTICDLLASIHESYARSTAR